MDDGQMIDLHWARSEAAIAETAQMVQDALDQRKMVAFRWEDNVVAIYPDSDPVWELIASLQS